MNKHTCTQQGSSLHQLTCKSAMLHSSPPPRPSTYTHTYTLFLSLQKHGKRRRSSTTSNGFPSNANLFSGNANLPDLVQQSTSPLVSPGDASGAQVGGAAPKYWPLKPPSHLILTDSHLFTVSFAHKPVASWLFDPSSGWEINSSHQTNVSQVKLAL